MTMAMNKMMRIVQKRVKVGMEKKRRVAKKMAKMADAQQGVVSRAAKFIFL